MTGVAFADDRLSDLSISATDKTRHSLASTEREDSASTSFSNTSEKLSKLVVDALQELPAGPPQGEAAVDDARAAPPVASAAARTGGRAGIVGR